MLEFLLVVLVPGVPIIALCVIAARLGRLVDAIHDQTKTLNRMELTMLLRNTQKDSTSKASDAQDDQVAEWLADEHP